METADYKVHFVYLGESLPKYVRPALELAIKHSGLDVVLLGNHALREKISGIAVEFIAIEEFYLDDEFRVASKRLSSPETFRSGFWHKTLERFFVLDQYLKTSGKGSIFHAELDQLLFRADSLITNLKGTQLKGLFFPLHNDRKAIASVLYCNSPKSLRSLVEFSQNYKVYENEMELLAKWSEESTSNAYFLPTIADELRPKEFALRKQDRIMTNSYVRGFVDAAQIGMWAGGLDPRNDRPTKLGLTKYVGESSPELISDSDLRQINFHFRPEDSTLEAIHPKMESAPLFNLHLHSKIHGWLNKNDKRLVSFFEYANKGEIPFVPSVLWLKVNLFLEKAIPYFLRNPHRLWRAAFAQFNVMTNRRPSSSPYLSGDSFRSIAEVVWEDENRLIDIKSLNPGCIVYCQSDLFGEFSKTVLANTNTPLVVILGNSDYNFESKDKPLFDFSSLAWGLAQNMSAPIQKMEPLPIGLENAWRNNNGVKRDFDSLRALSGERNNRIMWTFTVGTNSDERLSAAGALMLCKSADNLGPLTQKEHQKSLKEYSFVASPPGNGLDTHRTWEGLYLGCIPVVKRSYMTDFFEHLGLPIWIVDSYDELVNLEEADIKQKYKNLSKNLDHQALWTPYWIAKILEKSREVRENYKAGQVPHSFTND